AGEANPIRRRPRIIGKSPCGVLPWSRPGEIWAICGQGEDEDARMTAELPGERAHAAPASELAGLLAKVARGDEGAFAVVYDQFGTVIYGLVRRVLRDPAQSEEVTQEVLLEVWRTASRFDPGQGSARSWLMTLAHRRAVDRV